MLGGACCNTCIIGEDKFTANDGYPHTGWTFRSSIWSTAAADEATNTSGIYRFTKPQLMKFNTPHPDGTGANQHVQVKIKLVESSTGSGCFANVVVGYYSDSAYLTAGLYYHASGFGDECDYLILYKRDTGSSSGYYDNLSVVTYVPIRGLTLNSWVTLDVCLLPQSYGAYGDGDTVRAKVTLANGSVWGCQGIAEGYTTGAYVGLESAYLNFGPGGGDNTLYGIPEFDDFKFTYFRSTGHASCPNCNGPCAIFTETWDYSDVELGSATGCPDCVDCFWLVEAGTGRIASNKLEIDSGGQVRCRVPHPTNKDSGIVTFTYRNHSGTKPYIVLFQETKVLIDVDARACSIKDSGGTTLAVQGGLPVADDVYYTVEVCVEDGAATVTINGSCFDTLTTDSDYYPFFMLGSDAGSSRFGTVEFKKHRDSSEPKDTGCETCNCVATCEDNCIDPNVPDILLATIHTDGTTNAPCGAELDCAAIDESSFALKRIYSDPNSCIAGDDFYGSCYWEGQNSRLQISDPFVDICSIAGSGATDGASARVDRLWITPTGEVWALFTIRYPSFLGFDSNGSVYSGQLPGSGPYDCTALDGLALSYRGSHNATAGGGFRPICSYGADEGDFQFCGVTGSTITIQT